MKAFMKNKTIKKLWITFSFVAVLSIATLVGCSKSQYGYGQGPYGTFPASRYAQGYGGFALSTDDSMSIRDTEAYGRFLEEIMGLCRHNRNNGMMGEWHHGGSFGSPISSCKWATQNYEEFVVEFYMDDNPEHGSLVDIEFYLGANNGYFGTQWVSSTDRALVITGELRVQEDGQFRIVYDPGHRQPRIIMKVKGDLEDLVDGSKSRANITVEYGGDRIGTGKASVMEEEIYETSYDPYYDPYYAPYYNRH